MNRKQKDGKLENVKPSCDKTNTFTCVHCHFKTIYKESIVRHRRIHTGEKPFWCGACEVRFAQWTGLDFHVKKKHNNDRQLFRSDRTPMWVKQNNKKPGPKPSKAKKCKTAAAEMSKVSGSSRLFKCETCPFQTRYRVSLVRHRVLHSGDMPYSCSKCKDKKFTHYNTIYKHIHVIHGGDMKLLCKDIKEDEAGTGNIINSKDSASNSPEKTKPIKKMTKKTLNGVDVKKTKRKIFHCPFCEFSTFHSSSMSVHKRRHLNLNFPCKYCKSTFFSPTALRHHTTHKHEDKLADNSIQSLNTPTSSANTSNQSVNDGDIEFVKNDTQSNIEFKPPDQASSVQVNNEQRGMKRLDGLEFSTFKPEFPSGNNNRRLIDLLKVLKLSSLQMFGELQREALKMQRHVDSIMEQLKTSHAEINELNTTLTTTKQDLQNALDEINRLKSQLHEIETKPVHCKQEPKDDMEADEIANEDQEMMADDLETSIKSDLQVNGKSESETFDSVSVEAEDKNNYIKDGNKNRIEQLKNLRMDVIMLLNMLSPELNAEMTNVDDLLKQIICKGLEN